MSRNEPRIAVVVGTRPEIIKMSPIIRECADRNVPFSILHTGQHYSERLDEVFFEELELPPPDVNLEVGSGTHGDQTGEMIAGVESTLLEEGCTAVLVQGDTNSVLAASIAASKLDVEVGHVEAGLRSFDRDMPEEINRRVADHVGDNLFVPTPDAAETLLDEGLDPERIHLTGNTIVDAVYQNREIAATSSTILSELELEDDEFALMTVHRAENVDDARRFADILEGVGRMARSTGLPVVYPVHPRAQDRLREANLEVPDRIRVVDPLDFFDFLVLEERARVVLTDSGGVQEEACILGTPCVTTRENTERPETTRVGANRLVGTDPADIARAASEMSARAHDWPNPFGDGTAAAQIMDVVLGRRE